jgi:hypothetical protein|tara:strand:- start:230 stop:520 length:291 start_codon:yes stop_codon:yes gene_type:complete
MEDFEIDKTLVYSTSHVKKEDIDLLSSDGTWRVTEHDYGITIYVGDWFNPGAIESCLPKYSNELSLLVLFAVSLDCKYLKLDSDGPIYDMFPQYNW